MANEKRLIYLEDAIEKIVNFPSKVAHDAFYGRKQFTPMQMLTVVADRQHEIIDLLKNVKEVDAVEVADMKEFAEDVVYQFGYYCQNGGRLHITHGGLSTLELAFDILGWENPHPVPECECQIEGCHEHATCGTPTADGYKRVCGKHFAKMDGDGNG